MSCPNYTYFCSRFAKSSLQNMSESIDHNGIIDHIEGETVFVRIVQQSACAGCHAKSMCSASESKEKVVEVTDRTGSFSIGEKVTLSGQTSLGLQAIVLTFLVPLAIVIAAIACCLHLFNINETLGGVIGLSLLVPYYYIIYILRDKLKRHFIFTLKKYHPNTL